MLKIVVNSLLATSVGLFGIVATTLSVSASPTPILSTIASPTSTTANATNTVVANSQKVEGQLTETTVTAVGSAAGAGTDSQTSAGVNSPTNAAQTNAAVADLINNPLTPSGSASSTVSGNQNSINAASGANLGVNVGDTVQAHICLDGKASIGSSGDGSLANCNSSGSAKSVPEPATTGAAAILGAYLLCSRRRSKSAARLGMSSN